MNGAERKAMADSIFDAAQQLMESLYARWQCERDYEDIADYAAVIKPVVEKCGGEFVKMFKRPFGFTCKVGGVVVRYSINGTTYSWSPVR